MDIIDEFFRGIDPYPALLDNDVDDETIYEVYEQGLCWVLAFAGRYVNDYGVYDFDGDLHCVNLVDDMFFDIRGWRSEDEFYSQWGDHIDYDGDLVPANLELWVRFQSQRFHKFFDVATETEIKQHALWFQITEGNNGL